MIERKNVLIEISEKGLSFKDEIPVFLNHDASIKIGYAKCVNTDNGTYADFNLIESKCKFPLYPSIGFYRKEIKAIGLCEKPNVDSRITPIE